MVGTQGIFLFNAINNLYFLSIFIILLLEIKCRALGMTSEWFPTESCFQPSLWMYTL